MRVRRIAKKRRPAFRDESRAASFFATEPVDQGISGSGNQSPPHRPGTAGGFANRSQAREPSVTGPVSAGRSSLPRHTRPVVTAGLRLPRRGPVHHRTTAARPSSTLPVPGPPAPGTAVPAEAVPVAPVPLSHPAETSSGRVGFGLSGDEFPAPNCRTGTRMTVNSGSESSEQAMASSPGWRTPASWRPAVLAPALAQPAASRPVVSARRVAERVVKSENTEKLHKSARSSRR